MVSTRSQTNQTHMEDFVGGGKAPKTQPKKAKSSSVLDVKKEQGRVPASEKKLARKRVSPPAATKRASSAKEDAPPSKRQRKSAQPASPNAQAKGHDDSEDKHDGILINRAPVLHLWAASVTHFLHPKLTWSTCLSAGSAVSAICAVAKGRSIGTIDKKEKSEVENKGGGGEKAKDYELEDIRVMQFDLKLKDGKAVFSGKPQTDSESSLKVKFGEDYDNAKKTFEEALATWKGDEDDLNEKSFHMYENFRPTVAHGQKGWGRKGTLNLSTVRCAVEKS